MGTIDSHRRSLSGSNLAALAACGLAWSVGIIDVAVAASMDPCESFIARGVFDHLLVVAMVLQFAAFGAAACGRSVAAIAAMTFLTVIGLVAAVVAALSIDLGALFCGFGT